MSSSVSVAIVGMPLCPGNKEANLCCIENLFSRDAVSSADLVVLPELSIPGGFRKGMRSQYEQAAEEMASGESYRRISVLAKQYGTAICAGIVERCGSEFFITHFVTGQTGMIGWQRKLFARNPARNEGPIGGERLRPFSMFGSQCTILACGDALLPEPTILAGLAEVSLVLAPADCFVKDQQHIIEKLLGVRAMDLDACIVSAFGHCSSLGTEDKILASAVARPDGTVECADRRACETHVERFELELHAPSQRWGGLPSTLARITQWVARWQLELSNGERRKR